MNRKNLNKNIKRDIARVLLYFNGIDTINISSVKWDAFVYNRNNAHYDTLLYFCRLIYEDAIANQNKGINNFRTIEDNLLPKLFERFIYAFYKRHLPCNVSFQQQIKWKSDDMDMLPKMSADTIITSDKIKLIIDTKFYSKTLQSNRFNGNQTIISSHLYQLFAYVKNEAAHTSDKLVMGMLLYPQIDVPVKKAYNIDGNIFFIQTVDLNRPFDAIKCELLEIYSAVESKTL